VSTGDDGARKDKKANNIVIVGRERTEEGTRALARVFEEDFERGGEN